MVRQCLREGKSVGYNGNASAVHYGVVITLFTCKRQYSDTQMAFWADKMWFFFPLASTWCCSLSGRMGW